MTEPPIGGSTSADEQELGRLSRRDLLRWAGVAGIATAVPWALTACEPEGTTPLPIAIDPSLRAQGFVGGTDTDIGPGGWCWFQSPRTSIGSKGVLWLGSSIGGSENPGVGSVQATAFDTKARKVLQRRTVASTRQDDHTSPSVLALGDKVQISWALHQAVDYLELGDTSVGGVFVVRRIRRPASLTKPGRGMSYCSAHVIDGFRWILYRGEQFSWNLITSPDGVTWTARGLVVAPGAAGDRPYLHAASDGKKLHFLVTNGNPFEYPGTSVYAGTIDPDFTIRRADGAAVGKVGASAPAPKKLTRIAPGVAAPNEPGDTDVWLCDLRIVDRRPTAVLSRREPWPAGSQAIGGYRHQYLWARQRTTGWTVEPLCWGGSELFARQPDYTGLGAQDPSDPTRVVVSTNVHPVTGEPLVSSADGEVHWELFEGHRVGEGQWEFVALTANSVEDNLRPSIAAGGTTKTLSWMRGTYWAWTDFDTRIVVRSSVKPATAMASTAAPGTAATTAPAEVPPTTPAAPVQFGTR